jgi:hypothetical protein
MSNEVETSLTVSAAKLQQDQTRVRDSSTSVRMTKRVFTSLSVYHDESSRSAALNMAIDEALLETMTQPTIRFYRWDHAALSFGYFGKFADVADEQRDLVRRWTGGGIVFHGQDLTYALIIPVNDPAFAESSMSIYEKVHRAICNALSEVGRVVELKSALQIQSARMFFGTERKLRARRSAGRVEDFCSKAVSKMSILPRTLRRSWPRSCRRFASKGPSSRSRSNARSKLPRKNMRRRRGYGADNSRG